MIQPLVENAVVHGLEQMRSGGIISITVQANGDNLEIFVSDNGAGMDPQIQNQLNLNLSDVNVDFESGQSEHMGIALLNIQKRLQLIYGQAYGLSFMDRPGGGTTILLVLPLRFE